MTHPDLRPDLVDRARAALEGPDVGPAPDRPPVPHSGTAHGPGEATATVRIKDAAKRLLRPLVSRFAERVAVRVQPSVEARVLAHLGDLENRHELLRAEVQGLVPSLRALQAVGDVAELTASGRDLASELHTLAVNLELHKGELDAFRTALNELGTAIAPAAGLAGVPDRFAELRERVNALDRAARSNIPHPANPAAPVPSTVGDDVGTPTSAAAGFDYVGFEQRFRGDPDEILAILEDRYFDLLADHAPVLDVGCGRGELLAALAEHGVEGEGVDLDAGMVAEARAAGVTAHAGDAIAFLESRPERSFGAITAIHVAEHLSLEQLVAFLELSASRLHPGGVLVAETPNPTSLIVLGNSYILDPTHVWPLHPSLMTFLCERAGFRDVELRFHSPADNYRLPLLDPGKEPDDPDQVATINAALERLNEVLFGAQEYAAIATTPPEGGSERRGQKSSSEASSCSRR